MDGQQSGKSPQMFRSCVGISFREQLESSCVAREELDSCMSRTGHSTAETFRCISICAGQTGFPRIALHPPRMLGDLKIGGLRTAWCWASERQLDTRWRLAWSGEDVVRESWPPCCAASSMNWMEFACWT